MAYDNRETVSDYYPTIPPQTPAPEVDPDVLEAHLLARDNPHGVTTEQVGTYTKGVIDQKIADATTLNKTALNEAVAEAKSASSVASSSASSASSSARAAKTSEETATTKANEAVTSASAAATSASNAATSETNAAASADVATAAVEGFEGTVDAGVLEVQQASADAVVAINSQKFTVLGEIDEAKSDGLTAINSAVTTGTTTINSTATQATTEISQSVAEAVEAKNEAEQARDEASTSATNATEAKDTTVAIKDELQTALEEVPIVADVANKALPCALNDFEGWTDKIIDANILGKSTVISAPVGFIHIYDTNVPLAQKRVEWIKPNGDKVNLGAKSADNPWLAYQQTISCGWVDGDTVYAVATRSGVTYKATIPFVNGEPTTVTSVAVEGADVSGTALHSVKLSSGFVITSNGLIFNPNTLTQTAKLTLRFQRLVTSEIEDGVYVTTEDGTLLVNTDENGTPITTVKNASTNSMSTSASLVAISIPSLVYIYAISCLCIGAKNETGLPSIGFSVPAILQADIGDYIINRWGIFKPTNEGLAGVSIGNNVPLYRFKNLFKNRFSNDAYANTFTNVHRSGNSILFIFQRQPTYQKPCPALIIYKETEV